jgi:hypothetical protein
MEGERLDLPSLASGFRHEVRWFRSCRAIQYSASKVCWQSNSSTATAIMLVFGWGLALTRENGCSSLIHDLAKVA